MSASAEHSRTQAVDLELVTVICKEIRSKFNTVSSFPAWLLICGQFIVL